LGQLVRGEDEGVAHDFDHLEFLSRRREEQNQVFPAEIVEPGDPDFLDLEVADFAQISVVDLVKIP